MYRVFLVLKIVVSFAVAATKVAVVSSYVYKPNLTSVAPLEAVPAEDTEISSHANRTTKIFRK